MSWIHQKFFNTTYQIVNFMRTLTSFSNFILFWLNFFKTRKKSGKEYQIFHYKWFLAELRRSGKGPQEYLKRSGNAPKCGGSHVRRIFQFYSQIVPLTQGFYSRLRNYRTKFRHTFIHNSGFTIFLPWGSLWKPLSTWNNFCEVILCCSSYFFSFFSAILFGRLRGK